MKTLIVVILLAIFCSCDNTSGVKKQVLPEKKIEKQKVSELDREHTVIDRLNLPDGLTIEWYEKGSGEELKEGDLAQIDYKVKLKDGTVIDGNHMINKPSFPFLIGFGMQTAAWDLALTKLKVGDFARILIPSPLARGEKGIEGYIPSNADNLLYIRVLKKEKPDRVIDGTKVWIIEENKNNKLLFNEKSQIVFHGYASSPTNRRYADTYRTNEPFKYKLSDYGLVPGLRKALINAKKADKLYIMVPASEAYGKEGYLNIVKPNEPLFYDIIVHDVVKI